MRKDEGTKACPSKVVQEVLADLKSAVPQEIEGGNEDLKTRKGDGVDSCWSLSTSYQQLLQNSEERSSGWISYHLFR